MRLALTGAPGTGKTTLAAVLQHSFEVHAVRDLAAACGALGAAEDDGAHPIDVGRLTVHMDGMEGGCLIEGHLSHLLAPDAIVVLRCAPRRLQERLQDRGYNAAKVTANVEWELLGGVHAELRDAGIDVPLLELDTSTTDANVLAERVLAWREGGFRRASDPFIDWLADPVHLPS